MFCQNCGSQTADDAKFCESCGALLTEVVPAAAAEPTLAAPAEPEPTAAQPTPQPAPAPAQSSATPVPPQQAPAQPQPAAATPQPAAAPVQPQPSPAAAPAGNPAQSIMDYGKKFADEGTMGSAPVLDTNNAMKAISTQPALIIATAAAAALTLLAFFLPLISISPNGELLQSLLGSSGLGSLSSLSGVGGMLGNAVSLNFSAFQLVAGLDMSALSSSLGSGVSQAYVGTPLMLVYLVPGIGALASVFAARGNVRWILTVCFGALGLIEALVAPQIPNFAFSAVMAATNQSVPWLTVDVTAFLSIRNGAGYWLLFLGSVVIIAAAVIALIGFYGKGSQKAPQAQ